jgi:hypothetical protein
MEDCKSMATPMITNLKKVVTLDSELVDPRIYRKLIGSLMYLVNTRIYICFVLNTLILFMVEPKQVHWIVVKHVLMDLRGKMEYGLRYLRGDGVELQGYTDSYWEGSAVDINNTLGCCFNLGSIMITWFNKKKNSIALNSTEAKYMTTSMASCEAIWLHKLLTRLFDKELEPTVI